MPKMYELEEHLMKAVDTLAMAREDLRLANACASAVESMILLDLIGTVHSAWLKCEQLKQARSEIDV